MGNRPRPFLTHASLDPEARGIARRALIISSVATVAHGAPAGEVSADGPRMRAVEDLLHRLGWSDGPDGDGHEVILDARDLRTLSWAVNTAIVRVSSALCRMVAADAGGVPRAPTSEVRTLLDELCDLVRWIEESLAAPDAPPGGGRPLRRDVR